MTSTDNTSYIDLAVPGGRTVHLTSINGAGSGVPMKASGGQGRYAGPTLDLANLDYLDGPHGSYVVRLRHCGQRGVRR